MAESGARSLGSILLLAVATAIAAAALWLPASSKSAGGRPQGTIAGFPGLHAGDRETLEAKAGGRCGSCHEAAPHGRRPGVRAFRNFHAATMECGACHLSGEGLASRRFPPHGGKLQAARRSGDGWTPVADPGAGVALRAVGPRCSECHRRGSEILSSGLFDDYRQRVLEQPSVLFRLGGQMP